MVASPENVSETPRPIEELLLLHDQDPYGYIGHAIAFLNRSNGWRGNADYIMPIATFASETHDSALMQSCIEQLGEKHKWQLLAKEIREGSMTISIDTIRSMGEQLAVLEAVPERKRDYTLLADFYASRLDIIVNTDGGGLEDQITTLATIISGVPNIPKAIGRRAAKSLLNAGLDEEAGVFLAYLSSNDSVISEHQTLENFQKLRSRGKPLPQMRDSRDERYVVLRTFDPGEYVRQQGDDLRAGLSGTGSWDVLTVLQAGQIGRAQKLYEGLLDYTFEFDIERLQMALWMAQYTAGSQRELYNDTNTALESCRKLAGLITAGSSSDVAAEITSRKSLAQEMDQAISLVDQLPFSYNRIILALELATMQREVLPNSTELNKSIATLVTGAWNVVVDTMTSHYTEEVEGHPEVVRQLWRQLKDAGFNLYLKGTPEAKAIDKQRYDEEHWAERMFEMLNKDE